MRNAVEIGAIIFCGTMSIHNAIGGCGIERYVGIVRFDRG
jgi:hypothetical protein